MEFWKMLELFGTVLIAAALITFLVPQRAWGETSLLNLFTGQNENSNDGSLELGHKALDIKLDVEDSTNPNVYEFHMTDQGIYGNKHLIIYDSLQDEKSYFALRNWNKDKCSLFTTKKIPSFTTLDIAEDFNYVYYINPGSIIDSSCKSLDGCIKGNMFSSGCKSLCDAYYKETSQPSDFSVCGQCFGKGLAKEDKVLTQPFGKGVDYCNNYVGGCPSDSNGGCCPLVGEEPSKKYTPQYGLICGYEQSSGSTIDSNAKWFACTNDIGSAGRKVFTASAGGFQFKCDSRSWVVSGDQGINIENAQIRYHDWKWLGDYDTTVKFFIANYNSNPITDVEITAKIDETKDTDIDCDYDMKSIQTDKTKDTQWADIQTKKRKEFDSAFDSLNPLADDNFCWKAKTFNIELKYKYSGKDETDNFNIVCTPKTTEANDIWYDNICTATKITK